MILDTHTCTMDNLECVDDPLSLFYIGLHMVHVLTFDLGWRLNVSILVGFSGFVF
jgi:hypothetical protein